MDDYVDFDAPIMKVNPILQATKWKGKHYALTSAFDIAVPGIQYNLDILQREGQKDILDLVEANQWNWTTFLEIAQNCTRDLNGDGITDQWGILTRYPANLAEYILHSNGVTFGVDMIDGQPVFSLDKPAAHRAFQFVLDLAYIYKVYKVTSGTDTDKLYQAGTAAIYIWDDWLNMNHLSAGITGSRVAPLPMGPDVDHYQNFVTPVLNCILSTEESPNEVAKIFAEINIWWDENLNPIPEYQQVVEARPSEWTKPANRRISTQREHILSYVNLYPYARIDLSRSFQISDNNRIPVFVNNAVNQMIQGKMSVAQAIESIKASSEALLDEFR